MQKISKSTQGNLKGLSNNFEDIVSSFSSGIGCTKLIEMIKETNPNLPHRF